MTTALFMLSVIALIAVGIALLDWYAQRKDRQNRDRPAA